MAYTFILYYIIENLFLQLLQCLSTVNPLDNKYYTEDISQFKIEETNSAQLSNYCWRETQPEEES